MILFTVAVFVVVVVSAAAGSDFVVEVVAFSLQLLLLQFLSFFMSDFVATYYFSSFDTSDFFQTVFIAKYYVLRK